MDVINEQISAIKFYCWLKKSAVETVKLMYEVYTDDDWLGDLISSIGIGPPQAEKLLHYFPILDDH